MFSVTKRVEFDYGHRIYRHRGKCKNLHGHRGVAEVTFSKREKTSEGEIDELGMVVDFGDITTVLKEWIDKNWDHKMLLNPTDPIYQTIFLSEGSGVWPIYIINPSDRPGGTPSVVPGNPTAEVMARILYDAMSEITKTAFKDIRVGKVRIYETPTCWADYSKDN